MRKQKLIIAIIVLLSVAIGLFFIFSSKKNGEYALYEVTKNTVRQEISETGVVKRGEKISLSFKSMGRIKEVFVKTGDKVKIGEYLAKIDNTQTYLQLQEAIANLDLAKANLSKLLSGASKEEIQISQTKVCNAENTLKSKNRELENIRADAIQDLESAYEDAFNALDDSYLKSYNAQNIVDSIQRSYFIDNDQSGISVRENRDKIKKSVSQIKFYLNKARTSPEEENIDTSLYQTKQELFNIFSALEVIREVCEEPLYRNKVSSIDKTNLDTHRSYINTAYSGLVDDIQSISLIRIANTTNISVAENYVVSAQDALQSAKDNLALIIAEPREEDISLHQAKVKSAQARKGVLESQMRDTVLRSPIVGEVIKIEKFAGEIVQPSVSVISILPQEPLKIEVDIYEEDVVKMKIGNPVEISLVAFPEKTFNGNVIFIDPSEELIDGVVYYKATINFKETQINTKPGMSADVVIIIDSKEDVLCVSEDALIFDGEKPAIKVLNNGNIERREVEIGLRGSNDMVEIISGLNQGEQVIID